MAAPWRCLFAATVAAAKRSRISGTSPRLEYSGASAEERPRLLIRGPDRSTEGVKVRRLTAEGVAHRRRFTALAEEGGASLWLQHI
jgi:hypothetical protein